MTVKIPVKKTEFSFVFAYVYGIKLAPSTGQCDTS